MKQNITVMAMILALCGCAPLVVAGGVAAVGATATEERGLGGSATDSRIHTEVTNALIQDNVELYRAVGMKVYNRRVLLVGYVPTEFYRNRVVELAKKANGVREVINELQIGDSTNILDDARDTLIAGELDTRITFAKGVRNLNYQTRVLNGVVYIIGTAQSQHELERVLTIARNIGGVRQVVSHVEML